MPGIWNFFRSFSLLRVKIFSGNVQSSFIDWRSYEKLAHLRGTNTFRFSFLSDLSSSYLPFTEKFHFKWASSWAQDKRRKLHHSNGLPTTKWEPSSMDLQLLWRVVRVLHKSARERAKKRETKIFVLDVLVLGLVIQGFQVTFDLRLRNCCKLRRISKLDK